MAAPTGETAGKIMQQNQQRVEHLNQRLQKKKEGPTVVSPPRPEQQAPKPGGPTVVLHSIEFDPPSVLLPQDKLQDIADQYVDKKVDFYQISKLIKQINALYAAKGFVTAKAIVPPQKLNHGTLKIQLVEGQVGQVQVKGNQQDTKDFLIDRIQLTKAGTDTVDVPQAARDITYFNQTSQAQMRLRLRPGASFGLTNLTLHVFEPPANQLYVFGDNDGVVSTGRYEGGLYYKHYGLLGRDDTLTLYGVGSQGSLQGLINYSVPLTPKGLRLILGYTRNRIRIVRGPAKHLDIKGHSQAATATLMQPLFINQAWNVTALGSFSYVQSSTKISGVKLADSETPKEALGVSISYRDSSNFVSIQPEAVFTNTSDSAANRRSNAFLFTGTLNALHQFPGNHSLTFLGAWQVTGTKHQPGDLVFQLGGSSSVRGYPNGALSGDKGYYAQLEFHKGFPNIFQGVDFYVFSDVGQVFFAPSKNRLAYSAGLGGSLAFFERGSIDIDVAFPQKHVIERQNFCEIYARLTFRLF